MRKIEQGVARVRLTRSVKRLEEDGETIYEYEEAEVNLVDRPNLEEYITENFDALFEDGLIKERTPDEPTNKERIDAIEDALLAVMGV